MSNRRYCTAGTNDVPLHHESANYLKLLAADTAIAGGQPGSPEQMREYGRLVIEKNTIKNDFSGIIKDMKIPSKRMPGGIPIRVYQPSAMTSHPLIMVFFHSGGYVLGSIETCDHLCRIMSGRYGCIIVNVEYRRAPEVKLPEIIKDCDEAAKWALENKESLGGASDSLVGVAGSSAGGQIAGCASHNIPGLSFQILVYPMTDLRCELPAVEEFASLPSLTKDHLLWFIEQSVESEAQKSDPMLNLLLRSCHGNLPPALTLVAECDVLRDDGILYSKKLQESGCHSELILERGTLHGFYDFNVTFKEKSEKAYEDIGEFLERVKEGTLKRNK